MENLNSEVSTSLTTTENAVQPAVTLAQRVIKIQFHLQNMGQSAIIIGQELIECKKEVGGHGEWQNWLADNFSLSYRMAAKFMAIAERFSKVPTSALFSPSQLTELLALPAGEEEKFIEEHAAAGNPVESMTVKQTRAEVKKWKDAAEQAQVQLSNAQTINKEFEKAVGTLQARVESLQGQVEKNLQESTREHVRAEQAISKLDAEILRANALAEENKQLKNQPPTVVERTVTEIPDDYVSTKAAVADLQEQIFNLQAQLANPKVEYAVPEDYQANKDEIANLQDKIYALEIELAQAKETTAPDDYEELKQQLEAANAEIQDIRTKQPVIEELKKFYDAADYLFHNLDTLKEMQEFFDAAVSDAMSGNSKVDQVFKVLTALTDAAYEKVYGK